MNPWVLEMDYVYPLLVKYFGFVYVIHTLTSVV